MKNTVNISTSKFAAELVDDNECFVVYKFMRNELELVGTERDVYAIIYGFFKNGLTFTGSREYLASWSGVCIRSVDNAIASLLKKGYIEVVSRKRCGNEYTIRIDSLPDVPMHGTILKAWRENEALEAKRRATGEMA